MAYVKKTWKVYSIEDLKKIAKNCSSKEEFRIKHKEEYNFCLRKSISKEILRLIPHKTKWTKEALIAEAQKYVKISDWMQNNISSYNTALRKEYYEECISHMSRGVFSAEVKWTYEKVQEIYSKYTNIKELRINDTAAYNVAIRNGWHKELSKHLLRNWERENIKWTFENVQKEALKYNSIKEMQKGSTSAYITALNKKWLNDIVGHMKGGYTKWTTDKLVDVLSKHPKKEWRFVKECKAACVYIKRHKIEDKIMNMLDTK